MHLSRSVKLGRGTGLVEATAGCGSVFGVSVGSPCLVYSHLGAVGFLFCLGALGVPVSWCLDTPKTDTHLKTPQRSPGQSE